MHDQFVVCQHTIWHVTALCNYVTCTKTIILDMVHLAVLHVSLLYLHWRCYCQNTCHKYNYLKSVYK